MKISEFNDYQNQKKLLDEYFEQIKNGDHPAGRRQRIRRTRYQKINLTAKK